MMPLYCTGISPPPKSMSFAPSFWCAANKGVRFSIVVDGGLLVVGCELVIAVNVQPATHNLQPTTSPLPPFFRLDLFLRHFEINQHEVFGELDQLVRAAGVKDGVG